MGKKSLASCFNNNESVEDFVSRRTAELNAPHIKAAEYIREKMNTDAPEHDVQAIKDFLSGLTNTISGGVFSAKVDGISTYHYAETHKHDLPMMLRCCEEQLTNMATSGGGAAPYYFKRAAILAKKEKNYELEITICESLINAYAIYAEAYKNRERNPLSI